MEREAKIIYSARNLMERESIIIYEDEIIYIESNRSIAVEEDTIKIDDKDFIENEILGNIYKELKSSMIETYNKVKNMDPREIQRPKNSARKDIIIRDNDFSADIDMYIKEYGNVFAEFVSKLKKAIIEKNKK